MLIVKEALVKAEEFNSVAVNFRDTDVFVALLHHLDGDIHKNVNKEREKGRLRNARVSTIRTHRFRM